MEGNQVKRPLWFVMLVFLSILPMLIWFVAFQRVEAFDSTLRFVLTAFPLCLFAMLGLSYYLYPTRRELTWVLMALTWLSYAALLGLVVIS